MAFGFVLVGGRSSRMGRDKTLLPYRGRPMALLQAEKLAFVCGRAALVGKDPGPFQGCGYPFVRDESEPVAPVYGVVSALSWSPDETNLVLAADLPRCSEAFLGALLERAAALPAPAIVPTSGGRLQPLCAIWSRRALVPLLARVSAGHLSLRDALPALGALVLSEAETAAMPGGEPERFVNVNTPEDYEALEDDPTLPS